MCCVGDMLVGGGRSGGGEEDLLDDKHAIVDMQAYTGGEHALW